MSLARSVPTLCCHATKLDCQPEVSGHALVTKIVTRKNESLRLSVPLLGRRQLGSKQRAGRHTATVDALRVLVLGYRLAAITSLLCWLVEEMKGSAVKSWKRRQQENKAAPAATLTPALALLVVQRDTREEGGKRCVM